MRLLIILFAALLALAGCATDTRLDDGYQLGDLSGSIVDLQTQYCATADPRQRALLLAALEAAKVAVPDRGACVDLLTLAPDLDPGILDDIDVEAAERDRQEARQRLEE